MGYRAWRAGYGGRTNLTTVAGLLAALGLIAVLVIAWRDQDQGNDQVAPASVPELQASAVNTSTSATPVATTAEPEAATTPPSAVALVSETDPPQTDPLETDPPETDPSETDPSETDRTESRSRQNDLSETTAQATDPTRTSAAALVPSSTTTPRPTTTPPTTSKPPTSARPTTTPPTTSAPPTTARPTTTTTPPTTPTTTTTEPPPTTPVPTEPPPTTPVPTEPPPTTPVPTEPVPTEPPPVPYATLPDGSPEPVVAVFDLETITLTGVVPNAPDIETLSALALANSKTPATVQSQLTTNPAVPRNVGVRVIELNSVRFPEGSFEVLPEHALELDRIATVMTALPHVSVMVVGHADQRGDAVENQLLSAERARSVVNYLVSRGIDPARLASRAVGEADLLTLADDDTALALNRRTEFIFYGLLQG